MRNLGSVYLYRNDRKMPVFRLWPIENPHFWQHQPEVGHPRESIRSQDSFLPEATIAIAVAAMAAVSARRIVEPSEAETQPSF